jgi:hypothetical protein
MLDEFDLIRIDIDGKPMWRDQSTGRCVPVVSGGAEGDPPTPPTPPAPPESDPPASFTQADLDRIVGREKAEAKRTAEKQFAETLGVTVDEAKAIIAAKNTADDAAKSEAQRALDAATATQAEAVQAKADAVRERFEAKVERALVNAGVGSGIEDPAKAAAAVTRATRMVTLDTDSDDAAIAAEIEALKADVPGLFTTPTAAGGTPPSGVTGARPPQGGQGNVTALEAGAALYQSQKAS